MSVYFAYTIGSPDLIYYGKYFGSEVNETDLLSILSPVFKKLYSVSSEITISILSSDSSSSFSERDPIKYTLVYRADPILIYWNGKSA